MAVVEDLISHVNTSGRAGRYHRSWEPAASPPAESGGGEGVTAADAAAAASAGPRCHPACRQGRRTGEAWGRRGRAVSASGVGGDEECERGEKSESKRGEAKSLRRQRTGLYWLVWQTHLHIVSSLLWQSIADMPQFLCEISTRASSMPTPVYIGYIPCDMLSGVSIS